MHHVPSLMSAPGNHQVHCPAGPELPDVSETLARLVVLITSDNGYFEKEFEAIKADSQLQAQIIVGLEPSLQRFINMDLDLDPAGTTNSTSRFMTALRVLVVFACPCLERGLQELGPDEPAILETLSATVDRLLLFPAETVPHGIMDRVQAIHAAFSAARSIIDAGWGQRLSAEAVVGGLLAFIRQGAAFARLELSRNPTPDMASLTATLLPVNGLVGDIFPKLGCSLEAINRRQTAHWGRPFPSKLQRHSKHQKHVFDCVPSFRGCCAAWKKLQTYKYKYTTVCTCLLPKH